MKNKKIKYLIVIEETSTGFSAYSPDVNGCVATGNTKKEVENNMKEAIEFHLEGLAIERQKIPVPHSYSHVLEVIA
ncbi:MAG: type II toxin-antitoxin system HicB family antitoxin [Mariprofundales bacterium]